MRESATPAWMNATSAIAVVGEDRPDEFVEGLSVATGKRHRGEGANRGRARHVHRHRDLAELIGGPHHPESPAAFLAHRQHAAEDDVKAVALLALGHNRRPRPNLLARHTR